MNNNNSIEWKRYQYYLIIDLEATCCNKNSIRREEREIIEIGAVMVSADTLQVVDEFQSFVKPVRHATLTPFCTELTSITQSEVDSAPHYSQAITNLVQWMSEYPHFIFCSWGDYDKHQFLQDCAFHRIDYPFNDEHINIKQAFSAALNTKRRFGMNAALKKAGLSLQGTHHRGIDDARNMARLMTTIIQC